MKLPLLLSLESTENLLQAQFCVYISSLLSGHIDISDVYKSNKSRSTTYLSL